MLNHTLIFVALRDDLVASGVLPRDIIVALIRHFHPEHPNYVDRVSGWQKLLCSGCGPYEDGGPLLVRAKVARVWGDGFSLVDEPAKIAAVHQIAMIFWKEEVAVPPDWDSFANRIAASGRPDLDHPLLGKLATWIASTLGKAPSWDQIQGMSGTGATADRKDAISRWWFTHRPIGVDPNVYDFNARCRVPFSWDVIPTARASAVPKNRKSARIVASEPSAALFAQLGLMRVLDEKLRPLSRKIPLHNADLHRRFLVSHYREVLTLDLSDASDYISMDLMDRVLPADWFALFNSCRSQAVRLPDGRVIRTNTFAPMGNGFCFRTLSLICAGILACAGFPWSDFGDDMICHTRAYTTVRAALDAAGLVLNSDKCGFYAYKETCGLELWNGYDVTPLKLKKLLTYKGGYLDLSAAQRAANKGLDLVSKALCPTLDTVKRRYNRHLQRLEYRCPVWTTYSEEAAVDDYPGILRWHSKREARERYRQEVALYTRTRPGFMWLSVDPGNEFPNPPNSLLLGPDEDQANQANGSGTGEP